MPKKPTWNLEKLKTGFEKFYNEHKRYPTVSELDSFSFLPSSRQIQRRFGGIVELRKKLKLPGQHDLTTGLHSSERAKKINKRAHELEKQVHTYLVDMFGTKCVHCEFFFSDDRRTQIDFFIYYKDGQFSVDVFYPSDRRNLAGCLNSKLKKHNETDSLGQYPVIFLQMNDAITSDIVEGIVSSKKNKLRDNQYVMSFDEFKLFCKGKDKKKLV